MFLWKFFTKRFTAAIVCTFCLLYLTVFYNSAQITRTQNGKEEVSVDVVIANITQYRQQSPEDAELNLQGGKVIHTSLRQRKNKHNIKGVFVPDNRTSDRAFLGSDFFKYIINTSLGNNSNKKSSYGSFTKSRGLDSEAGFPTTKKSSQASLSHFSTGTKEVREINGILTNASKTESIWTGNKNSST